ncbi:hypothetical protein [Sphingobacterium lumbrici]|uniref:hypothetical protein n=1 Tax=Sphingobacterium lumbrici TaxID=2559600 RepID=UPI00112A7AFD|nr:hypothetical protein [Sphingobacterium lumbrici]
MKKLIIILFVLVCNGAFAQSAIADLKFEEAETAFNRGANTTTLIKLDEFDKIYGSVTAKSLYLRIMTQNKILNRRESFRSLGFSYSTANLNSPLTVIKPFSEGINTDIKEFDIVLSIDGIEIKETKQIFTVIEGKYGKEYDGGDYIELIIKRENTVEPIKLYTKLFGGFYSKEENYELLASLRKNANAYLKAMESEGLDDKYREVYDISEKLKQYPADKQAWLKEKQRIETERIAKIEEEKRKEEEQDKYYREIAPKIDAWEWKEGIKIGGNFNELKTQYPDMYKNFRKNKRLSYSNSLLYENKYDNTNSISSIAVNSDDIITTYSVKVAAVRYAEDETVPVKIKEMKQFFRDTFGNNVIFEKETINRFEIGSPYSNNKISINVGAEGIYLHKTKTK